MKQRTIVTFFLIQTKNCSNQIFKCSAAVKKGRALVTRSITSKITLTLKWKPIQIKTFLKNTICSIYHRLWNKLICMFSIGSCWKSLARFQVRIWKLEMKLGGGGWKKSIRIFRSILKSAIKEENQIGNVGSAASSWLPLPQGYWNTGLLPFLI